MASDPLANLHIALKGFKVKGRAADIDLYERFMEIKDAAKDWLKDLGKNGYEHSARLEEYLAELTRKLMQRDLLTQAEIFVLLCATYLHDIGYWQEGQLKIEGHPRRSRELIENRPDLYLLEDFCPLGGKVPGVAQAIGLVCYGHCEETHLPLAHVPNSFTDQSISSDILNLRKLSALLRLADEADDPYIRLSENEATSIRSKTSLVKIGEETIRWYWNQTGAEDPGPWVRHLEEKQRILVTSIDYLRDITKLSWYLVLEPQVPGTTLPLGPEILAQKLLQDIGTHTVMLMQGAPTRNQLVVFMLAKARYPKSVALSYIQASIEETSQSLIEALEEVKSYNWVVQLDNGTYTMTNSGVQEAYEVAKRYVQSRIPIESSAAASSAEPTEHTDLSSELVARFQILKKLHYSADRDAQLKQLIIYGLNKDAPELIAGYVQDLSCSTDRDEMYKKIFDHAINTKRYHLAEELIDRLSYSTDQDTARKKLLKARTND